LAHDEVKFLKIAPGQKSKGHGLGKQNTKVSKKPGPLTSSKGGLGGGGGIRKLDRPWGGKRGKSSHKGPDEKPLT